MDESYRESRELNDVNRAYYLLTFANIRIVPSDVQDWRKAMFRFSEEEYD